MHRRLGRRNVDRMALRLRSRGRRYSTRSYRVRRRRGNRRRRRRRRWGGTPDVLYIGVVLKIIFVRSSFPMPVFDRGSLRVCSGCVDGRATSGKLSRCLAYRVKGSIGVRTLVSGEVRIGAKILVRINGSCLILGLPGYRDIVVRNDYVGFVAIVRNNGECG